MPALSRRSSKISKISLGSFAALAALSGFALGCAVEQPEEAATTEAAQSASAWTTLAFGDRPADSNEAVSIATDAQGRAHAVYRARDGLIHYVDIASRRDEIVDATRGWTATPRLAVDASGQPHAVFMSSRGMLHARRNGSSWTVDQAGINGWVGAIAIDATGVLHVASSTYSAAGVSTATHSTKRQGAAAFEHTPIPGKIEGEIGFDPTSLAVDRRGTVYIALDSFKSIDVAPRVSRAEPPHAYLAKRPAGGAFTVDVLGTSATQGLVAVDSNEVVHLVTYMKTPDTLSSRLVYIKRAPSASGWSAPEAIPSGGFYGALAVDASGTLHLAAIEHSYLRYARRPADGTWTTGELISEGEASSPSLALDTRGNAVIAFASGRGYAHATRRSP